MTSTLGLVVRCGPYRLPGIGWSWPAPFVGSLDSVPISSVDFSILLLIAIASNRRRTMRRLRVSGCRQQRNHDGDDGERFHVESANRAYSIHGYSTLPGLRM